jgi:hypothetical protein
MKRVRFENFAFWLTVLPILLGACTPPPTPEVIRDTSRQNTLTALAPRPTDTPSVTLTPGDTPTPYTRPTNPALDLDAELVRMGDETITLGEFRARVRYERWATLDRIRLIMEGGGNPPMDVLGGLANTQDFGNRVMIQMMREIVLRQEFAGRGFEVGADAVRAWWLRTLDLQADPNRDQLLPERQRLYTETAMSYAGFDEATLNRIIEDTIIGSQVSPIIGRERAGPPSFVRYRLRRLQTEARADADAAYNDLRSGEPFRTVACRYDPDSCDSSDLGAVGGNVLAPEVVSVLESSEYGILPPIETANGFDVIEYLERTVEVIPPSELERTERAAFEQWMTEQLAQAETISEAWRDAIPTDPQPEDVSPLIP